MSYEELKLENQICHRLYIASNGFTRLYRPLLKKIGLTYPQYVIMMALWEKDGLSMGELASRTLVDKGFLTTTIEKLKSDGLLKVDHDERDKRKKLIALTSKGRKLQEKARCVPHSLFESVGKKADRQALLKLAALLDDLNKLVHNKSGPQD